MRRLVDPRADLEKDHLLWVTVLGVAEAKSNAQHEPAMTLEGLRCLGAELVLAEGALRISQGREMDAAEYKAVRTTWLMPYKGAIVDILAAAAKELPTQDKMM